MNRLWIDQICLGGLHELVSNIKLHMHPTCKWLQKLVGTMSALFWQDDAMPKMEEKTTARAAIEHEQEEKQEQEQEQGQGPGQA